MIIAISLLRLISCWPVFMNQMTNISSCTNYLKPLIFKFNLLGLTTWYVYDTLCPFIYSSPSLLNTNAYYQTYQITRLNEKCPLTNLCWNHYIYLECVLDCSPANTSIILSHFQLLYSFYIKTNLTFWQTLWKVQSAKDFFFFFLFFRDMKIVFFIYIIVQMSISHVFCS